MITHLELLMVNGKPLCPFKTQILFFQAVKLTIVHWPGGYVSRLNAHETLDGLPGLPF